MVVMPLFGQSFGSSISSKVFTQSDGKSGIETIVYDNGLGDIVQEVSVGITPSENNLIVQHEYDDYRREVKTWLPVETGDLKSTNIVSLANSQYSDNYAYSEIIYDDYGTVGKERKPGKNWQNKTSSHLYVNTNT